MSDDLDSRILVALEQMAQSNSFDKYIKYAVFPNYKNLVPSTKINFNFPLTVFVGQNGTGKSSLLHALFGMPKGESTGRYWFSTDLDAITEGGELGQHRYFYGHILDGKIVQTRKARVTKHGRGADYWEPTKVVITDGMDEIEKIETKGNGRSKDRWDAVARKVLFLNFKSELSAYDKYMYFGRDPGLQIIKTKQDRIRRDSIIIKRLKDQNAQNMTYFGTKVVSENRLLTNAELNVVSEILGRSYDEARLIRHRLFEGVHPKDGLSVVFRKKNGFAYSEAHAGSGEVAVVSAVTQILQLNKNSLILLDEPEVSLHPGAQRRLLRFLLKEIKTKHHQVILSTHSPELVRGLPSSAVKVMEETESGRFQVLEDVAPSTAFNVIGSPAAERLTIYVEDAFAKMVVSQMLRTLPNGENKMVDIRIQTGGASAILTKVLPILMNQNAKFLILLDGDQMPTEKLNKSSEIPTSKNADLGEMIKKTIGGEPSLPINGNGGHANDQHKVELQRRYIDCYLEHVDFLPVNSPEEIVLRAVAKTKKKEVPDIITSNEAKSILIDVLEMERDDIEKNEEVNHVAKDQYKKAIDNCDYVKEIVNKVRPLIFSLNAK